MRAPSRMHLGTAEVGINTGAAMAAGMHPSLVATPEMYAAAAGGIKAIYGRDPRYLSEWVVQFEDYLRSIALGMPTDATTRWPSSVAAWIGAGKRSLCSAMSDIDLAKALQSPMTAFMVT